MYTVIKKSGERDLSIEQSLSRIEGKFARIRQNKLDKRLPLTLEEEAAVCTFVAAMFGRTKTYREHLRSTWGRALDLMEKVEEAHKKATPEQREQMHRALQPVGPRKGAQRGISKEEVVELVANPLQNMLPVMVQAIAPQLIQIPWVVLVAPKDCSFVTSDTPCVWFDKGQYQTPRTRYAGGLASPTIEVTMPLSPRQIIMFSNRLRITAYWSGLSRRDVESLNERTISMADEFVVRNTRHPK